MPVSPFDKQSFSANITQGKPFDITQGKPFDITQGKPFDITQGKPFDITQGKPFDITQGKPAAGSSPADNLSQKPPIPPGEKRLIDFIKVPAEQLFSGIGQILFLASVVAVIGISIIFLSGYPRVINPRLQSISGRKF